MCCTSLEEDIINNSFEYWIGTFMGIYREGYDEKVPWILLGSYVGRILTRNRLSMRL